MIPEGWQTYKLVDLVEDVAMGPFGSNLKVDNFIDSGVPVIRGTNLNKGGFQKDNFAFVSESKAMSLKRSLAYPDDLVFTHRGTIGQVGIIPKNQYPYYLVSQSQMRLSVDRKLLDPKFLYYFFLSSKGQSELLKNASQVGVPAIASPTRSLKEVNILVPSLVKQSRIAAILSSFDDKIELNLQMNKTLESIAQAIFKEWFVDFRFPGFDGELVDGLPRGWRKIPLTEAINTISVTYKFVNEEVVFLNTSDILNGEVLNHIPTKSKALPGQAKKSIQKDDILFSEIRPANRRFAYIDFDSNNYVVSTKLMVLRSKGTIDPLVIYYFLKRDEALNELQVLAESRSGTFPQITYNELGKLNIIIPDDNTNNIYTSQLRSTFYAIRNNQAENQTLIQLRDTLLPKLMTGKIRMK
jgi:type I restriction enzyme S subunit